jgi:hypothetical protein
VLEREYHGLKDGHWQRQIVVKINLHVQLQCNPGASLSTITSSLRSLRSCHPQALSSTFKISPQTSRGANIMDCSYLTSPGLVFGIALQPGDCSKGCTNMSLYRLHNGFTMIERQRNDLSNFFPSPFYLSSIRGLPFILSQQPIPHIRLLTAWNRTEAAPRDLSAMHWRWLIDGAFVPPMMNTGLRMMQTF